MIYGKKHFFFRRKTLENYLRISKPFIQQNLVPLQWRISLNVDIEFNTKYIFIKWHLFLWINHSIPLLIDNIVAKHFPSTHVEIYLWSVQNLWVATWICGEEKGAKIATFESISRISAISLWSAPWLLNQWKRLSGNEMLNILHVKHFELRSILNVK